MMDASLEIDRDASDMLKIPEDIGYKAMLTHCVRKRQRGRQREKRQEGEKERGFLLPQTPQKQETKQKQTFHV